MKKKESSKQYHFYNPLRPFDHKDFYELVKENQQEIWPEL